MRQALHLAAICRADAASGCWMLGQTPMPRTLRPHPLHTAVTADAQGVFQVRSACFLGLQSWDTRQTDFWICQALVLPVRAHLSHFVKWGYMSIELLSSSCSLVPMGGIGWGPQKGFRAFLLLVLAMTPPAASVSLDSYRNRSTDLDARMAERLHGTVWQPAWRWRAWWKSSSPVMLMSMLWMSSGRLWE